MAVNRAEIVLKINTKDVEQRLHFLADLIHILSETQNFENALREVERIVETKQIELGIKPSGIDGD